MLRILPALIIFVAVLSLLNYLPIKRNILYSLNLSGDPTTSCCKASEILSSNGDFDENSKLAFYDGKEIDYPKTSLADSIASKLSDTAVLGLNASDSNKWIEVSLDQQKLRAWEGNNIVKEFPISSGLWHPTPKGDYKIWMKTRFQRMTGGSKELGTFYDLPNVPYNMFFKQGFALHGAYWHSNFGHPMSHGCVNEPVANAADMFEWAGPVVPAGKNYVMASAENPGTRVFIH